METWGLARSSIIPGAVLRRLREAQGWSREQAAERAGIAVDTLGRFEREEHVPSLPVALALARVFGVTVEELVQAPTTEAAAARALEVTASRLLKGLDDRELRAVLALLRELRR